MMTSLGARVRFPFKFQVLMSLKQRRARIAPPKPTSINILVFLIYQFLLSFSLQSTQFWMLFEDKMQI